MTYIFLYICILLTCMKLRLNSFIELQNSWTIVKSASLFYDNTLFNKTDFHIRKYLTRIFTYPKLFTGSLCRNFYYILKQM